MFPPAEYFNNLKASQMRQTQQAGFHTQAPRSNSTLMGQIKQLNSQVSPPRITTLTPQSILPPATPNSNLQTVTEDYGASVHQPKLLSNRGIRFYNKVVEDFQNKFYQKKTRPSSIKKRAEQMYDDNIQLKHQINQLKEQVTMQKTQNKLLNNELEKQNQLMAQILGQTIINQEGIPHIVIEETTIKQTELIGNLKRELDKALKSLAGKETEIKQINKISKVTKYRELEEECKMYMNECMRQNRLLKKFLYKSGLARSPAIFDSMEEGFTRPNTQEGDQNTEWQEKIGFYKNQNFKLKDEVAVLKQRYDIQAQQSKTLSEQKQQLVIELEKLKAFEQSPQNPKMIQLESKLSSIKKSDEEHKLLIENLKAQVDSLIKEKEQWRKEKEGFNKQVSQLEEELKTAASKTATPLKEKKQFHTVNDVELKKAQKEIVELEEKLQSAQLMLSNSMMSQQNLQSQIGWLNQEMVELQVKNQTLREELSQKVQAQIVQDASGASDLEVQLHEIQSQLEASKLQIQDMKTQHEAKLNQLQKELDEKESELENQSLELDKVQSDKLQLRDEIERLRDTIDELKSSPQEVIRDDQEVEKAKEDLVNALESIRRYRELTEKKEQEIVTLQQQHNSIIADKDSLIQEKHTEVEDLQLHIRNLEQELQKVKENPIIKEVEVFKMPDKQESDDDNRYEEMTQQIQDLANQVQQLNEQLIAKEEIILNKDTKIATIKTKKKELKGAIANKDADIEQLQEELIEVKENTSGQDQDMLQKLQDLMVSLQLKEQDMVKQGELIEQMNIDKELKEKELDEIKMELSSKDAEITTVRKYFDKAESEKEKLEKEIETHKKAASEAKSEVDKLKTEYRSAQDQLSKVPAIKAELDALKNQIEGLNSSLDSERHHHLIDIQQRFRRCLEILQINSEEALALFLKNTSVEEDLEEYLAMKFNMTKAESVLFLKRVLNLPQTFTKEQMIAKFISNIGKDVEIINKDTISKAYSELVALIIEQSGNVEEFLKTHNFDKQKVMHYYLVEKIMNKVIQKRKGANPESNAKLMSMITTHLLNLSRNFYQIETKVLRDQLLKNVASAQVLIQQQQSKQSVWGDDSGWKEEKTTQAQTQQNKTPEKVEDEYDYYEEEEELDEEEKLMMEDEKTNFNNALQKLKTTVQEKDGGKDETGMVIQLSKNQLNTSQGSLKESPPQNAQKAAAKQAAQPPAQKVNNPQLQQFSKFLTTKKMNLRQFLKIYHVGSAELSFLDKEIEVVKFDEFVSFTKQQNIFSEADLEKFAPFSFRPIEETLEGMLKQYNCIHDVSKPIKTQVIELVKLVENLALCGYQDYKRPIPRKNFDFNQLDIKSIRIMNRLSQYVYSEIEKFTLQNKINGQLSREQKRSLQSQIMESLFKDSLKRVNVHTNTKDEMVYLINNEDFFKKLVHFGVRKSSAMHENLNSFLTVDNQYQYLILFKKLIKTVEVFHENGLFNQVGLRRSRLDQKPSSSNSPQKGVTINAKNAQEKRVSVKIQENPIINLQQAPQPTPIQGQTKVQNQPQLPKQLGSQKPSQPQQNQSSTQAQKKPQTTDIWGTQPKIEQPVINNEEEYEYGYEYGEEASPAAKTSKPTQKPQIAPPTQKSGSQNQTPKKQSPKANNEEEYEYGYEYGEEEESPAQKKTSIVPNLPINQVYQQSQYQPQLPMPNMLPQQNQQKQQQARQTYSPFSFHQPMAPAPLPIQGQPQQTFPQNFNFNLPQPMQPINQPFSAPQNQGNKQNSQARNLAIAKQPSSKGADEYGEEYYEYDEEVEKK